MAELVIEWNNVQTEMIREVLIVGGERRSTTGPFYEVYRILHQHGSA